MRSLTLACCLLSGALLAACGNSSAGGSPSSLVPEDAAVYGTATLDPEGQSERAVQDIAARFPGGDELDAQIEKGLTQTFREDGLDYAKDVKPWLGDEAVFFVTNIREEDADAAAVVETTDEGAARDAFEKAGEGRAKERSYEGTDYLLDAETAYGVVDGHAVIGTEGGFRAAVDTASGDESIEGAERVDEALSQLPEDALAKLYFDGRKLISAMGPGAATIAPFIEVFDEPYVVGISAESDAVVVDSTLPAQISALAGPLFFGGGTDAVQDLPRGSFYAAGQPEVGKSIKGFVSLVAGAAGGEEQLEQQVQSATGLDLDEDILAWMGDLGAFASGTSLDELQAGAVIETKDPDASRRTLDVLGRLARREADPEVQVGELTLPGGGDGFTLKSPELPAPVHVVQRGERLAVGLGDQAAQDLLEPSDTLGDDAAFTEAAGGLGDGFEVANYVDVAPILELAENEGAESDAEYRKAKPYLEPFALMVAGTREDDGSLFSRSRIEFR